MALELLGAPGNTHQPLSASLSTVSGLGPTVASGSKVSKNQTHTSQLRQFVLDLSCVSLQVEPLPCRPGPRRRRNGHGAPLAEPFIFLSLTAEVPLMHVEGLCIGSLPAPTSAERSRSRLVIWPKSSCCCLSSLPLLVLPFSDWAAC